MIAIQHIGFAIKPQKKSTLTQEVLGLGSQTAKKNIALQYPNSYVALYRQKIGGVMKFGSNIGMLLLSIYLILVGVTGLVAGLAIPPIAMAILALVAGIFLLIGR